MLLRQLASFRRLSWALMGAVLFAALAPSVSAWLAARGPIPGTLLVELCSGTGSRWVRVAVNGGVAEAGKASKAPASQHVTDNHCPYCHLHQTLGTPPEVAAAGLLLPPLAQRQRWTVRALPYQAVAWAQLPSRGPPARS
jgi:hypothetical protein